MQILVLDIGCSYTKGYLFNNTLDIIADYKLPTDITSPKTLEACVPRYFCLSLTITHIMQSFRLVSEKALFITMCFMKPTHKSCAFYLRIIMS